MVVTAYYFAISRNPVIEIDVWQYFGQILCHKDTGKIKCYYPFNIITYS